MVAPSLRRSFTVSWHSTLPTEAAICSKNFPRGDEGSPVRPVYPSTHWSSLQPLQMPMISSSLSSKMRMWSCHYLLFKLSAIFMQFCHSVTFIHEAWCQFNIAMVMKLAHCFISATQNRKKMRVARHKSANKDKVTLICIVGCTICV